MLYDTTLDNREVILRVLLFLLLPFYLLAQPFKVASYNVQNLFDVEFQGNEYKE